jgi:hypothetical protein
MMDVATMRMINPTAIATMRRLIERLIIDPERPTKRWSMTLSDLCPFERLSARSMVNSAITATISPILDD